MPTSSMISSVASWIRSSSAGDSTSHLRRGAMGSIRVVIAATSQGSDDRSGDRVGQRAGVAEMQTGPVRGKRAGLQTAGAVDRADADGGREHGRQSITGTTRGTRMAAGRARAPVLCRSRRPSPRDLATSAAAAPSSAGQLRLVGSSELEGARLGAQLRRPALARRSSSVALTVGLPAVVPVVSKRSLCQIWRKCRRVYGRARWLPPGPTASISVQRQGLVVGAQPRHERLGVADQMVAEQDRLVAALETGLQVAHVVQQRRPRESLPRMPVSAASALHCSSSILRVGVGGIGEARQAVPARQVRLGLVALVDGWRSSTRRPSCACSSRPRRRPRRTAPPALTA